MLYNRKKRVICENGYVSILNRFRLFPLPLLLTLRKQVLRQLLIHTEEVFEAFEFAGEGGFAVAGIYGGVQRSVGI